MKARGVHSSKIVTVSSLVCRVEGQDDGELGPWTVTAQGVDRVESGKWKVSEEIEGWILYEFAIQ
jgi:hypothetical protein